MKDDNLRAVGVVANKITVANVGRPSVAVGESDVVLASKGITLGRGQRSPRLPETSRGKRIACRGPGLGATQPGAPATTGQRRHDHFAADDPAQCNSESAQRV